MIDFDFANRRFHPPLHGSPKARMHSEFQSLPGRSIHDVLLRQAKEGPSRVLLEFGDRKIRYGESVVCASRFASSLRELGIEPGDRVGIMLPNRPEFIFAFYGALMTGATVVPYNVMLKPGEIEHLARDSGTRAIIVQDSLLPDLLEGVAEAPDMEHVIVVGEAPEAELAFNDMVHQGEPDFRPVVTALEDLALLVYTSGTTGRPKGAMLTHANVLSNLAALSEIRPARPGTRVLCVLPLFHCFGLIAQLNLSVMRGDALYLHPRFEAEAVIDALLHRGITQFAGTPTMYFHILNHPKSQGVRFPALQRCGCGGAPLPIEIRRAFRERFGVDITEGYGLSESTVSACGYPEGYPIKSGSVGVPIPGLQIRVIDEHGLELRIGEIGEIALKGPNIMAGYWNRPEETEKTLVDGWLYTGDLGYIDDQGFVFIVDRKKDLIIKGGYNIYPREVEEAIYQLEEIDMAAVIGVPDDAKGEVVQAIVSLKSGRRFSPEQVMDHLRKTISKYKLPETVTIIDTIPTGPTGKILKRELRQMWIEATNSATR
jgi:long-chain acyl-CoA synthetase